MPEDPHDSSASTQEGLPAIPPDFAEQNLHEALDNIIPTRGYEMLPMVGLGGSAGSLTALQEFFTAMPATTGMVFVVVVHLSPEHSSRLPELLARVTKMRVQQAVDGERVEANSVYVIPPGRHLASVDGHLRLSELAHERGTRVAVDLFFRSLADTHGPHAAAIILSGADGDGALGVKRIKERGGLTIAQDPDEAEHHGMPQSAIGTGMVDWVLRVAEMPRRLLEYRATEQRLRVPPEEGPQPAQAPPTTSDEDEAALREVLTFLRTRTGRDFAYYKRATIVRRVSRRMQINSVENLPAYLAFLRTHLGEAGALLQDLLISVTNFFRDRDSFNALEALIPELFRGKGPDEAVRVWIPACATGEEAYTIAMLLLEHARTLEVAPPLQIFACDLDDGAVQLARAGSYPETIIADVSEERLRRFFLKEARGWRIRREVREIVLFAEHDLLKDAPFSRMDLVSCRNLFIYLNRDAQTRALDIFHFALKPQGLLFLGSSESVEEESPIFEVADKKNRIYRRRSAQRVGLPVPVGPGTLLRALEAQEQAKRIPVLPGPSFESRERLPLGAKSLEPASLSELHLQLVERLAAPSVIVNADREIVHLSENAGKFFTLVGGETSTNLLRLVHPMLRVDLRSALFRAEESGADVEARNLPLELEGRSRTVTLRVLPAGEAAPGFMLVVFEMSDASADLSSKNVLEKSADAESIIRQLERELERMKARLRATVEQYEASSEELKASNEELQAMNEELRSASEELETSREELQSINEELSTVNAELKVNIEEVGRTNSDLHNLMSSTAIATVFLDRELRIMRYTPTAATIFRVIPSDVGRLLTDLRHQLDYPELNSDAGRVLEKLSVVEREVRDAEGRQFLARLLPYRTLEDHIGGVVLTFVDVTELQRVEESRAVLAAIVEGSEDSIISLDFEGRITSWNAAAERLYGYSAAEALGRSAATLTLPERLSELLANLDRIRQRQTVETVDALRIHKDGHEIWLSVSNSPVRNRRGDVIGLSMIARDVTARRAAESAVALSEEQFRRAIEDAPVPVIMHAEDGQVLQVSNSWTALTGYEAKDIGTLDVWLSRARGPSGPEVREQIRGLFSGKVQRLTVELDVTTHANDQRSWVFSASAPGTLRDGRRFVVGMALDITERKRAEDALRESRRALEQSLRETESARAEAEAAGRSKDHFLAVLSHELRTPLTPILMSINTLMLRSDLPAQVTEGLQMIQRNVRLEAQFIDELLDITRISRDKFELTLDTVDLHKVIRQAAEVVVPDIESKKQRLSYELEANAHTLSGDNKRLQQVFWNVLKNASKFTPEKGLITIRSRNEPRSVKEPTYIVVEVIDTGIGFSEEAAGRIFDAFAQANASITQEFGGLGLGLAISKATVDAHGGSIRGASPGAGQGATFTVSLPLSEA